jgi:hypothetical protein
LWGAEHGVNAHGVAIGNEKIWTVDDPHALPPALLGMDLVRIGLERGSTADAAREAITSALSEHGQGGSGEPGQDAPYFSSFLVVDARGGWVIETSARSWAARPVGDGSSISNRISLSTDWTLASDDVEPGADFDLRRSPAIPTGIADHRLAATRACIARRSAGTNDRAVADAGRDASRPRRRSLGRTRILGQRPGEPGARLAGRRLSRDHRVHARRWPPGDDRGDGRRAARRRTGPGVGLSRQSVRGRVRALLPARRCRRR